ncbi:MAG: hypothetical protein MUE97_03865 [Phycisphaerales bacterium]|jgi:hypothetical protein|nr:hypothetical protein [Phycisphaerales bacterium]
MSLIRRVVPALVAGGVSLGVCAPASQAQSLLYAVGGFGNAFQTQSLYQINPATGAATLVGSTGLTQISGIAWNGASLLAYTTSADVFILNVGTGAATPVASSNDTQPEGDIAFGPTGLVHLSSSGQVSNVSLPTATLSPVVSLASEGSDFSGLLVTPIGNLALALNGTGPDTVTLFSGTQIIATVPTGTNGAAVGALATDGQTVWMSDGTSLFTISTSSGAATLVGGFGITGVSGLAFIPAPGAVALLGLGAGLAARRRR